jgi:hypothetical protein
MSTPGFNERVSQGLKSAGPIVPFESISPFLEHERARVAGHGGLSRPIVWATAGMAALATFMFIFWLLVPRDGAQPGGLPLPGISMKPWTPPAGPSIETSTGWASQDTADSGAKKDKRLGNSTVLGENTKGKRPSATRASTEEGDDLRNMDGEGAGLQQVVIPASWAPMRIKPFRVFVLDSAELANMGMFITRDGSIVITWGGRRQNERGVDTLALAAPVLTQGQKGRTSEFGFLVEGEHLSMAPEDSALQHAIDGARRHSRIFRLAFQTDETGRMDFMRSQYAGAGLQGPDLTRATMSVDSGRHVNIHGLDADSRLDPLIPILVRTRALTRIFWFEPSENLFLYLPKPVLLELEAQARGRESRRNTKLQRQDVSFAVVQGTTSDSALVQIRLRRSSELGLALYDLQGNRMKELTPLTRYSRGRHYEAIALHGVRHGVYLLAAHLPEEGEVIQTVMLP